jgi:hypothetical protein
VFEELLPADMTLADVVVRPKLGPVDDNWRDNVRASLEGESSNQGRPFDGRPRIVYNGLFYRSQSEVAIARTLDQIETLLYLPDCASSSHNVVREPDFLIFYRGRAGVLEVDGPTHKGQAADDHQRDSFFQRHGLFVKRYRSEDCVQTPEVVVKDFLQLLIKSPAGSG